MSDEDKPVRVILPCGHTPEEHRLMRLVVEFSFRAFLVGIVIGGLVGIVAMLVFS